MASVIHWCASVGKEHFAHQCGCACYSCKDFWDSNVASRWAADAIRVLIDRLQTGSWSASDIRLSEDLLEWFRGKGRKIAASRAQGEGRGFYASGVPAGGSPPPSTTRGMTMRIMDTRKVTEVVRIQLHLEATPEEWLKIAVALESAEYHGAESSELADWIRRTVTLNT